MTRNAAIVINITDNKTKSLIDPEFRELLHESPISEILDYSKMMK